MAILVDYQSTMMLKKYTYMYRSMRESLQDLQVVRGGRKSSSDLTYFNQAKLANADIVNNLYSTTKYQKMRTTLFRILGSA